MEERQTGDGLGAGEQEEPNPHPPPPFPSPPSAARAFAADAAPSKTHGGLADEDRIFTNLYRQGDPFLKVREKREERGGG